MNKPQIKKTENSYFEQKVFLRIASIEKLQHKKINILDCFSADSKIWDEIKRQKQDYDINVTRIEKEDNKKGFYLKGDNLKFLENLCNNIDFDIIDLDAFGSPVPQLELILKRCKIKKDTIFFLTFIQTQFGGLNLKMLEILGYAKSMIKKCPTLFFKNGFEKMIKYLFLKGFYDIIAYRYSKKNYISCKLSNPV